jgi:hypothetical protein
MLIDSGLVADTGKVFTGGIFAASVSPPPAVHSTLIESVVTYTLPFVMSFLSHLILQLIFRKKSNAQSN